MNHAQALLHCAEIERIPPQRVLIAFGTNITLRNLRGDGRIEPFEAKGGHLELAPPTSKQTTSNADAGFLIASPKQMGISAGDLSEKNADQRKTALGKLATGQEIFLNYIHRALAATDAPYLKALVNFFARNPLQEFLQQLGVEESQLDVAKYVRFCWKNRNQPLYGFPEMQRFFFEHIITSEPWLQDPWLNDEMLAERQDCLTGEPLEIPARIFPTVRVANNKGVLVSNNSGTTHHYGLTYQQNAPVNFDTAVLLSTTVQRQLSANFPHPTDKGVTCPKQYTHLAPDNYLVTCAASSRPEAQAVSDTARESIVWDFRALQAFSDKKKREGTAKEKAYAVTRLRVMEALTSGQADKLQLPSEPCYVFVYTFVKTRLMVSYFLESQVDQLAQNLQQHFADIAFAVPYQDDQFRFGVSDLFSGLVSPGQDVKKVIPQGLWRDTIRAILEGKPYPRALYDRAIANLLVRPPVTVARTEKEKKQQRSFYAALAVARAVSVRGRRFGFSHYPEKEITPMLDPERNDASYLFGRLVAMVARAQQTAYGQVGRTVTQQHFKNGGIAPARVHTQLVTRWPDYIAAIGRRKGGGLATIRDREISDIAARLPAVVPNTWSREEKQLYASGWAHQHAAILQEVKDNAEAKREREAAKKAKQNK